MKKPGHPAIHDAELSSSAIYPSESLQGIPHSLQVGRRRQGMLRAVYPISHKHKSSRNLFSPQVPRFMGGKGWAIAMVVITTAASPSKCLDKIDGSIVNSFDTGVIEFKMCFVS